MSRVLVFNCGSSGLKWSVLEGETGNALGGGFKAWPASGGVGAASGALARAVLRGVGPVDAVGHRFVFGGARFRSTVRISPDVREELGDVAGLDPLHMAPALAVFDAVHAESPVLPQMAVFDTTFHADLPAASAAYALPHEWTERWELRRLGFHGLSVEWAVRRAARMLGGAPARVIVAHLGSGCSVTAVRDGRSVETTMGFTPLEGLMMATRSGSVDPGLLLHLQIRHGMTAPELWLALSTRSGLLGVSGISSDLRDVIATADAGLPRPALAYAQFIRSIRLAIGGMIATLGGVDVLVFTGGIGEHLGRVRADATSTLGYAGVGLDPVANAGARGDADISSPGTPARVMVIAAREDLVILGEVRRVVREEALAPPVSGRAPGPRRPAVQQT